MMLDAENGNERGEDAGFPPGEEVCHEGDSFLAMLMVGFARWRELIRK